MKKIGIFIGVIFVLFFTGIFSYFIYRLGVKILQLEDPTTILVAIIALIGYGIKYYLDRQAELNKQKRDIYLDFVNIYIIFFRKDITWEILFNEDGTIHKDFWVKLYDIMQRMVLYAPSNIYLASNDFWAYIRSNDGHIDTKILLQKITNIFKLMRKDIWLDVNWLGEKWEKLLWFFIKDYDEVMKK